MPPAKSRVQQRSIGIYIVIASVLGAGAAIYFHLPGMALVWLGLIVAAWMEPPAIMSGSKDASGYPTAANTREEACLARSRFWRSLKFRMIMPNSNWLPGWTPLGAFFFAVIAAVAAWQLPVLLVAGHPSAAVAKVLLAHHHPIPKVPFAALRWVDAVAAFIVCVQVTASRRSNRPEGGDCPGTRVNSVPALFKKPIGLAGIAAGLLLGGAAFWAAHHYIPPTGAWAVPNVQYAAVTAALLLFGVAIAGPWRSVALDRWRFLAATAATWERHWVAVKQDKPSPRLLDHRIVGAATIEEFESPPSSGASVFYALTAKLGPAVGAGSRIAILEMPDTDRKGQPIPGTRHPRRFQVVTWPADDKLDLTDQALSAQPDVAELALRCSVVWALDPLKIERPVLLSSSMITEPGKPAAWMTAWAWPDGPGIEAARALISPLEAETGSRVLVDSTAADAIYFGALDSPAGDYAQTSGEPFDQALARLKFEDKWSQIWASVMKLSGGRAASQAERTAQMPTMITRRKVGPAIVDEFSAPTSIGAAGFMLMGPKLVPAIGAGTVVAVLPMPETNRDGERVPGSRHPVNFQVVTWRASDTPDLTDPDVPVEVAELWINCAVGNALDPMGIGRPTLLAIEPIGDAGGHVEDPDDEDADSPINTSKSDPDDGPAARGTMAWRTQWQPFGAADLVYLRNNAMDGIAGSAGCEVLIDQRALNSIFFGALTSGTTAWLPGEREPWETVMQNLSNEDKWTFRWDQVYPAGKTNQPTIQPKTHRSTTLPSGVKLERVAFIGRTGMDPTLYKGLESKFATALQAAPFVSITGYPPKGEPAGSRHAMGFYITWSNGPVPANPGDMAFSDGAQWVIAGLVNNAFDAAFGASKGRRPEVVSSRALTGEGRPANPMRPARRVPGRPEAQTAADKHIWEVQVRLYGGVTLAEIRGVAQKIRQGLGAPWLRIAPAPSGVTLFFGAPPAEVTLINPNRDKLRLTALDWQQAFLDTGLSASQGLLPELTAMSVLPKNTAVQVLDFQCPPGLDPSVVRGNVEKLCTATANEYVEVRAGVGGADTMRMLSAKENPLPKRAAFDFDAVDNMEEIPFATDISGEYVTFNPQIDPHLLIAGGSGSGKAQPLSTRIPVPVSDRFPAGWATIGTLQVGDKVFAADGTTTRVIGFSLVTVEPTYTLHFVDGQTVEAGANHLWKVATAAGRAASCPAFIARRTARATEFNGRARDLRALAATIQPGTVAPMSDIARLLDTHASYLNHCIPKALGTRVVHSSLKKASQFDTAALKHWAIGASKIRRGVFTVAGNTFTPADLEGLFGAGEWLTAREIGDLLMGRRATRSERDLIKQAVRYSGAGRRDSTATVLGTVYPVDEVLTLLAERIEYQAGRSTSGIAAQPLETVVSTAAMFASVHRTTATRKAKNYAVRLSAPVSGPNIELPISPLALGLWLGDGVSRTGEIASATAESCTDELGITDQQYLIESLNRLGYPASPKPSAADRMVRVPGLRAQLLGLGLLQNKHIPAIYMRASVGQRLDLLRGLMDTDGTVDANGSCSLDLCDETLINDALELIRSLGLKTALTTGVAAYTLTDPNTGVKTRTITGTRWRINFTSTMQVFTLPRKAVGIKATVRPTQDWNYIEAITVGESVPMRCLMVDHPEHLYLTDGFVPTHNSVALQGFLHGWLRKGGLAAVIDPSKGAADFKFAEPYSTAFAVDVASAAALMKALYAEVVRRKDMNAAAGVGGFRDLENPPKPYLVVIDEFTSLIGASPVPPPSDDPEIEVERQAVVADNGYRSMIGAMAGKIAREARSAGFTLILGTQRLTAKMLDPIPGSQDLRTNLSRMLVGKATTGEMQSALRAPFDAPNLGAVVPKGRALWETSAGAAQAVQGWYAPQSYLAADLAARLSPLDPSERIDIGGYMPKPAAVAGVTEEVSFLGEMDFSLDELELDEEDDQQAVQEEEEVEQAADEPAEAVDVATKEASERSAVEHDEDGESAAMDALFNKLAVRPEPFDQDLNPALAGTLLCLDIDGVLSPLGPDNPEWVGWLPVVGGPAGSAQASTEMLTAITDFGVRLAWLTTWTDEAPAAFTGLLPSDMPILTEPAESDTWWKIDALLAYLGEHPAIRRVAFADDHLTREDDLGITHAETLAEALDDLGIEHLLISTDPAAGLTVDELDTLRTWITAPPAPVQYEAELAPPPEPAVDATPPVEAVEQHPFGAPEPVTSTVPSSRVVEDADDDDPFGPPVTAAAAKPAVAVPSKPAVAVLPSPAPVTDDDDPFGPPVSTTVATPVAAKPAPTPVADDDPFGPPTTAATPQRPIRRFQTVPDHDDNPFD